MKINDTKHNNNRGLKVLTNSITQAKANTNNTSNKHIKTRHNNTIQPIDDENDINLRHVSEREKDHRVERLHKMKFKIDNLPRDKYFNIVGPSGGQNKVTQRVTL